MTDRPATSGGGNMSCQWLVRLWEKHSLLARNVRLCPALDVSNESGVTVVW